VNLIGIDLGVHKIALAVFTEDELSVTHSYVSDAPMRDVQLLELGHYALGIAHLHDVDQVWVEEPLLGNNHKYSLAIAETKGAILGSISHLRPNVDIQTVNVQRWKKTVIGRGNATKEQIRDYIDVTHSAYAPLCDGDQDRYDATCIGIYGLLLNARAAQLLQPGQLVGADRPDDS